jgi:hypothetical protein
MGPKTQNGDFFESVPNGFEQNSVIYGEISQYKTAQKVTVRALEAQNVKCRFHRTRA